MDPTLVILVATALDMGFETKNRRRQEAAIIDEYSNTRQLVISGWRREFQCQTSSPTTDLGRPGGLGIRKTDQITRQFSASHIPVHRWSGSMLMPHLLRYRLSSVTGKQWASRTPGSPCPSSLQGILQSPLRFQCRC